MDIKYRIKAIWDKTIAKIAVTIIIFIFTAVIIPFLFGYKICWMSTVSYDWDAIGAVATCVAAVSSLIIPIVAVYLAGSIQRNVGQSNADTYDSIEKIRSELDSKINDALIKINMYSQPPTKTPEQILEDKKVRALKFVNISMVTYTKHVAQHLGITDEEAFEILKELVLHDRSISCGGQLRKENMQNVVWTKK